MERADVVKLIKICSVNYRNWPEEGKEEDTVLLWESALSDIPFHVGKAAVIAHISQSVFEPKIADIRNAAAKIMNPEQMDAMESWGLVLKSIRYFGYHREKEALDSLPADVADMVRRFSFREICMSEEPDVIRAQWRMAWDSQAKRNREYGVLPENVRNLIESSGVIKRIGGGEDDHGRNTGTDR